METTLGKSDYSMSAFTVHSRNYTVERRNELGERLISKTGSLKEEFERQSCIFEKAFIQKIKSSLDGKK